MNCTLNKIVNLYKPTGPSSFNMVRSVKKILGVKKAGHIGTLDPLAEGVLPICLNRSTRIIPFLASQEKVYEAGMELGTSTDTQDSTGKPLDTADASKITEEDIQVLREAGWDDGEVLEINQVTAYFNYANRFVLGLGVDTAGDILGLSPEDSDDPESWRHR